MKTFSWLESSALCQAAGASLPIIHSRAQIEEILEIIKLSPRVYGLDSMFIAASVNNEKVHKFNKIPQTFTKIIDFFSTTLLLSPFVVSGHCKMAKSNSINNKLF